MKTTTEALDAITLDTWNTFSPERFSVTKGRLFGRMAELAIVDADIEQMSDEEFDALAA